MKIVLIAFLFLTPYTVFHKTFLYDYTEGDVNSFIRWDIHQISENQIHVQSNSLQLILGHTVVTDTLCDTRSWSYINEEEDTRFRAVRSGDWIRFQGIKDGEELKKQIAVAPIPWLQFLGFSLSRFAASGETWMKFLCIYPKSLKPYTMLAKRKGVEEITVAGHTIRAVRIRVSLTGILSHLGGVNFWFRESDYVFVRFEGTSLPWTSRIIYQLNDRPMP